jgi:ABC-type antimicrobial peptide transport system permease subunit
MLWVICNIFLTVSILIIDVPLSFSLLIFFIFGLISIKRNKKLDEIVLEK